MWIFTCKRIAGPTRLKPVAPAQPETPWAELWEGFCTIIEPHSQIRDAVLALVRKLKAGVVEFRPAYE